MTKSSREGLINRAVEKLERQEDQDNIASGSEAGLLAAPSKQLAIGGILAHLGKLREQDIEYILRLQEKERQPFGQTAVAYNLVATADVQYALAIQSGWPFVHPETDYFSRDLRAAYDPFSQHVDAIRSLRTQLSSQWLGKHKKIVAIVSPRRGEGRSYLAANLAVVFAQIGCRTLLVDADFRFPSQHQMFKAQNSAGLSSLLSGRLPGEDILREVPVFSSLRLLVSGPGALNPADLLASPVFSVALSRLKQRFDVILIDSPCNLYPEVLSIAANVDRILMVMRKHHTPTRAAKEVPKRLGGVNGKFIGCVLSDF